MESTISTAKDNEKEKPNELNFQDELQTNDEGPSVDADTYLRAVQPPSKFHENSKRIIKNLQWCFIP